MSKEKTLDDIDIFDALEHLLLGSDLTNPKKPLDGPVKMELPLEHSYEYLEPAYALSKEGAEEKLKLQCEKNGFKCFKLDCERNDRVHECQFWMWRGQSCGLGHKSPWMERLDAFRESKK